jgi:hypothetical protein
MNERELLQDGIKYLSRFHKSNDTLGLFLDEKPKISKSEWPKYIDALFSVLSSPLVSRNVDGRGRVVYFKLDK